MFKVYFNSIERPKYNNGDYDTFDEAVSYVSGWLANVRMSVPSDWDGKPFTFIEGCTIEVREERMPTTEERVFFDEVGLQLGFDIDDEKHQFRHICWPGALDFGPLCGSDRLWFYGDFHPGYFIDCRECWVKLNHLRAKDPVLLRAIGTLARLGEAEQRIMATSRDYLFVVDNQEKVAHFTSVEESRKELDEAMDYCDEMWKEIRRSPKPIPSEDGWKLR